MKLTVFTPTYNRSYCLDKLYQSLVAQTNKNFVWLIVDDGSVDDTAIKVEQYRNEGIIDIVYIKQRNGGKHVATNRAITECKTDLFFCVDSDDFLMPNAIETILLVHVQNIDEKLLGYYFRRVHADGTYVASAYPRGVERVGITELYHKYNFRGDTAIVLKTRYIKKSAFPVFEGERFVTERVWYNCLNNIAPMLLREEGIYVCEYLPDGYTKNAVRLSLSNPMGSAIAFLSEAESEYTLLKRSKNYAQYLVFVELFNLNNCICFAQYRVPSLVKTMGMLLKKRYLIRYRQLLKEACN